MDFWKENVGQIITSNGFPLLANAGNISKKQMEQQTEERYLQYDQQRKIQEARKADQEDDAELNALEHKIKSRKHND
jgi:hypothetical protein